MRPPRSSAQRRCRSCWPPCRRPVPTACCRATRATCSRPPAYGRAPRAWPSSSSPMVAAAAVTSRRPRPRPGPGGPASWHTPRRSPGADDLAGPMKAPLADLPILAKFLLLPAIAAVLMVVLAGLYVVEQRDTVALQERISNQDVPRLRELSRLFSQFSSNHVQFISLLAQAF